MTESLLRCEHYEKAVVYWHNSKLCLGREVGDKDALVMPFEDVVWILLTRHGEMTLFVARHTADGQQDHFATIIVDDYEFDDDWQPPGAYRVLRAPGEVLLLNNALKWRTTVTERSNIEFHLSRARPTFFDHSMQRRLSDELANSLFSASTVTLRIGNRDRVSHELQHLLREVPCSTCCLTKPFSAADLWDDDELERALTFHRRCVAAVDRRQVGYHTGDTIKVELFDSEFVNRPKKKATKRARSAQPVEVPDAELAD